MIDLDIKLNDLAPSADILAHAYDPDYAHRYYLMNRRLKGRKTGSGDQPKGARSSGSLPSIRSNQTRKPSGGKKKNPTSVEKTAEERLVQLKARLDILRKELRRLVEEAQKRSGGVDPGKGSEQKQAESKTTETKSSTKETSTKDSGSKDKSKAKPLTAAEKQKKAKADKERYDKANKQNRTTADDIRALQEQISQVRARLAAATARARENTAKVQSNGIERPLNTNGRRQS